MRSQDVIWTALPNGRKDAETLKLSVYISPRLMTDEGLPTPMLSGFKDFLNWPTVPVRFSVFLGAAGPFAGRIVTAPAAANDLYTAVFKPTTFVRPHQFPIGLAGSVHIRSYPARHIRNFVKNLYVSLIQSSPDDHPSFQELSGPLAFGAIGFVEELRGHDFPTREERLTAALETQLKRTQVIDFEEFTGTEKDFPDFYAKAFLQAKRFHQPRSGITELKPGEKDPVVLKKPTIGAAGPDKAIDFHQMVSLAAEHPSLLRYFGFVVDLEFTPQGVPFGPTTVRVVPDWTPQLARPATQDSSPETRCNVSSGDFMAAPRATLPDLADGALPFDDPSRFELLEIDHDGAALKAMHFANNLQRSRLPEHSTDDTPAAYAPPNLRSGGLSMAQVGMARKLLGNIQKSTALDADFKTTGAVLDAEDVTRGYAVHVWDSASGKWHSLLDREGTYDFVDKPESVPVDDEGAVSLAPTSDPLGASSDLYQQETLFLWSGWSLAAQRPGNTLAPDPAHDVKGPMQRYDNTADADFRVQIRYKVKPKSLPRLRYNVAYRIRARAVDLAGNRIPFGDPTAPDPHASTQVTYARFEPVESPIVLLRRKRTSGESVEHLVIRSNYNTPPPATGTTERHISPAKVAEMVAEEHGLFDTPDVIDHNAFALIVAKDDRTYANSPQAAVDPNEYENVQFFDVDTLKLPFLPDPIGRGSAFNGLPGAPPGAILKMPFIPTAITKWPAYVPFRFILQEGTGAPTFDVPNAKVTVQIAKADVVNVRYSSYLEAADLQLLGMWRWLPAAAQALLSGRAADGQLWALTPWRTLTLIHAVRQPLLNPAFVQMPGPFRDAIGQTFAFFTRSQMSVSRKSTASLKVFASWPEAIDAGPGASVDPTHETKSTFAFQVDLSDPELKGPDTLLLRDERQEFHDTKYRRVTYRAVATSKFVNFFEQRATPVLNGFIKTTVDAKGFVPETVKVRSPDLKTTYIRDRDYTLDEAAGKINRTAGGSSTIVDGATVAVDYVAPPVERPGPSEAPLTTTVDIPNSARPAAAKVLYIVPTWKWASAAIPGGIRSARKGGGLRVYLDRPWWSSGDGELLGVLLWPGSVFGPPAPPDELKPYVSRWGIDPIHASLSTTTFPTLDRFPLRTADSASPLSIEELGTTPQVLVAGHQVGFDTIRKLWYCDIEVNPGPAYFPFVRLALARYQPISLTNAHLSRVVLADFIQTAPGRLVTVVRHPGAPRIIDVTAVGISYAATRNSDGSVRQGPAIMRAQLEQRSHKFAGELGWEPVGQPVDLSPAQQPAGIETTWTGRIVLPPGDWPKRLVLEERERLSADGGAFGPASADRLVYTDIVPVSPERFGVLEVSPPSIDFGSLHVGSSSPAKLVTVKNVGTAPLNTGTVHVTGTDAGMFHKSADNASGRMLAPGNSANFKLTFHPTTRGIKTAQGLIPNSAVPNPAIVSLTGRGLAPVISLSALALNFGIQKVGTTSTRQKITITNAGDADLHLGTLTFGGPGASSYLLTADCSGQTVAPGGACDAMIAFTPPSKGLKNALLRIPSDAGPVVAVTLIGVGGVPIASVTPQVINFGFRAVGSASPSATVQVVNTGDADLVFGLLSLEGTNPDDFVLISDGISGKTLAPTAVAFADVAFAPTATRLRRADLLIPNDAGGAKKVRLRGRGL